MKDNYKILEGVKLGPDSIVEDYCIVGVPPRGQKAGDLQTVIGAKAHIRSHTVIYAGNKIGNHFQTGNKVNILEFNEIVYKVSQRKPKVSGLVSWCAQQRVAHSNEQG